MCGLYGIVDYKKQIPLEKKWSIARTLAVLSEKRGTDAAGFCALREDGTRDIYKVDDASRELSFSGGEFLVLLGHTRNATIGLRTAEAAHPYAYRHHVLAHNGYATNIHHRNTWAQGESKVDSETMLRWLVVNGGATKDGIEKFFREWSDSTSVFAISLLEPNGDIIFFKDGNPLSIAQISGTEAFVYCSEADTLKTAMAICGVELGSQKEIPVLVSMRIKHDTGAVEITEIEHSKYGGSASYQGYRGSTSYPQSSGSCSTQQQRSLPLSHGAHQ